MTTPRPLGPPVLAPPGSVEREAAARLLATAGLPALGGPADVLVALGEGGAVVGTVALETYGDDGLLRSLAVHPAHRGWGVGARLVAALEAHARDLGLDSLALLTTTAAPFFAARGYREVERAEVPKAVRASSEFRGVCPSSATCFVKRL